MSDGADDAYRQAMKQEGEQLANPRQAIREELLELCANGVYSTEQVDALLLRYVLASAPVDGDLLAKNTGKKIADFIHDCINETNDHKIGGLTKPDVETIIAIVKEALSAGERLKHFAPDGGKPEKEKNR